MPRILLLKKFSTTKKLLILLIAVILYFTILEVYIFKNSNISLSLNWLPYFLITNSSRTILTFTSNCECRKDEVISVEIFNETEFAIYLTKNQIKTHLYNIPITNNNLKIMNKTRITQNSNYFTCAAFKSLRRGPHQRVLAYSLYGQDPFYYKKLPTLTKQVKEMYPTDWFIRIYHDSSINQTTICEIECLTHDSGGLMDNLDFCDLSEFKVNGLNTILKFIQIIKRFFC